MPGVLLAKYEPKPVTSASTYIQELASISMGQTKSGEAYASCICALSVMLEGQDHHFTELYLATSTMQDLHTRWHKKILESYDTQTLGAIIKTVNEYDSRRKISGDGSLSQQYQQGTTRQASKEPTDRQMIPSQVW